MERKNQIRTDKRIVCRKICGDYFLLSKDIGNPYLQINELGYFIWRKLVDNCSINSIILQIVKEYEVEYQDCLKDSLLTLLKHIHSF